MTHTPSQMPDEIWLNDIDGDGNVDNFIWSSARQLDSRAKYIRADLVETRAASVPSDKERAEVLDRLKKIKVYPGFDGAVVVGEGHEGDGEEFFQDYYGVIKRALTAPGQSATSMWTADMKSAAMKDAAKVCEQHETIKALVEALEFYAEDDIYIDEYGQGRSMANRAKEALALAEKARGV